MTINRKLLGTLIILFAITIVTFYTLRTVTKENEQKLFEYIVRADDTCAKIAVGLNVSVISIVEANNLKKDCRDIYIGQVLFIPYPTPTPFGSPIATSRNVVIDCDREKYTVKIGDTLETIANEYRVRRDAIVFFNGLTKDKIEAGMELVIPLCYPTPSP